MQKCAKCKHPADGAIITEGGVSYPFCNTCTKILETFPVPTHIMHIFLKHEDMMSQADKNIFEARRARLDGERAWHNKE